MRGRCVRRFGEPPEPGRRYEPRPGAYGVILVGRRALVALTESCDETILLPGGGVDPGESPLRALHREAMEETGWRIRPIVRVGAYRRFAYMPEYDKWAEKVCHVYLCRGVRPVAAPSEPDHTPVLVDIGLAGEMLSIDGDRALFAEAVRKVGV